LKVVCKTHDRGSILGSIGSAQAEAPMWIVILEHGEEDVEDSYPSEWAAYISLTASHFSVEVKSFESFETFCDPLGEWVWSAM